MSRLSTTILELAPSPAKNPNLQRAPSNRKGGSFREDVAGWLGKAPKDEEYKTAMDELKARLAEVEGM